MTDGIISRALQAHAEREASNMTALKEATEARVKAVKARICYFVNSLINEELYEPDQCVTIWLANTPWFALPIDHAWIFEKDRVVSGIRSYEYHVAGMTPKMGDYVHILEDRGIASLADLGTAYTILKERGLLPK